MSDPERVVRKPAPVIEHICFQKRCTHRGEVDVIYMTRMQWERRTAPLARAAESFPGTKEERG